MTRKLLGLIGVICLAGSVMAAQIIYYPSPPAAAPAGGAVVFENYNTVANGCCPEDIDIDHSGNTTSNRLTFATYGLEDTSTQRIDATVYDIGGGNEQAMVFVSSAQINYIYMAVYQTTTTVSGSTVTIQFQFDSLVTDGLSMAVTYSGVDQTDPITGAGGNTDTDSDATSTFVTSTDGLGVDFFGAATSSANNTPDSGQTEHFDDLNNYPESFAHSEKDSSGATTTMGYTNDAVGMNVIHMGIGVREN